MATENMRFRNGKADLKYTSEVLWIVSVLGSGTRLIGPMMITYMGQYIEYFRADNMCTTPTENLAGYAIISRNYRAAKARVPAPRPLKN